MVRAVAVVWHPGQASAHADPTLQHRARCRKVVLWLCAVPVRRPREPKPCANTAGSRRQEILGETVRSHGMRGNIMAAVCQVTGAVPGFGHNISHSHRRTKRRFDPNIQKKTYFVPSLGRKVTLTLSVKGIKLIDARGIESVVADLQKRGVKF